MVHRLPISVIALCALTRLFAETGAAQPVVVSRTEHVDFAAGGTIRVQDSFGSLIVEGWDRPGVELTVVKSMGFISTPAQTAAQRMDTVHVTMSRGSGNELTVSTNRPAPRSFAHPLRPGSGVTVEYHIRAPRSSRLVINHAGGQISVTGMTGDIEARSHRGDIALMLPDLAGYSIDAHSKLGVVTSDADVATRGKASPGSKRLVLRMGFGGIEIKELPHEAVTPSGS